MKRHLLVPLVLCITTALALQSSAEVPARSPYVFAQPHMGTVVQLKLFAANHKLADAAAMAAFAKIEVLERVFSDYRTDSEVRQLTAVDSSAYRRPVRVSRDLWNVLVASREMNERTSGAFDLSVGPLSRLWRRAARQGQLPSPQRVAAALNSVGSASIVLENQTVFLSKPTMRLDTSGIAKGYIADQALAELAAAGCAAAIVDAGGDLAVGQAPADKTGWKIALAPLGEPLGYVRVANCGVATSGDAHRGFKINGHKLSHVIDPRTGQALCESWSATVISDDCMEADALASAATVMGRRGVERLTSKNVRLLIAKRGSDGQVQQIASPGLMLLAGNNGAE